MKWVLRVLATIVVILVLIGAGGFFYVRGSLPQVDGTIEVAGLSGPVEILRDKSGIPHIEAATMEDAVFGLGFAHAQDRLWQMETNRRIGAGRLSEILGEPTLGTDKFLRTLGIYESSKKLSESLNAETTAQLEAYTKGDRKSVV